MKSQSLPFQVLVIALSNIIVQPALAQQAPQQSTSSKYQPSPTYRGGSSEGGYGLPNGQDPSRKIALSLSLTNSGNVAAQKGDWKTAATDYQEAVALWPDNSAAAFALGDHDWNAGNLSKALTGVSRCCLFSSTATGTAPNPYY